MVLVPYGTGRVGRRRFLHPNEPPLGRLLVVKVRRVPYPESIEVAGVPFERWDAQREMAGLHALAEDEDVRRFLQLPGDEAGLAAMSQRFAEHWETHGFGRWAARPADGLGAGWVGACHPRWHPEFADRVELA